MKRRTEERGGCDLRPLLLTLSRGFAAGKVEGWVVSGTRVRL